LPMSRKSPQIVDATFWNMYIGSNKCLIFKCSQYGNSNYNMESLQNQVLSKLCIKCVYYLENVCQLDII
jgi:hypothetical protein